MSSSEHWRNQGNEHYKSAWSTGLDLKHQKHNISLAISAYNKAINKSRNAEEHSSASKNYALATWRMATLLHRLEDKTSLIEFYLKEALSYFSKSLQGGSANKSVAWREYVITSYGRCIQEVFQIIKNKNLMERVVCLETLMHCMDDDLYKADCYIEIGKMLFLNGISALSSQDYKTGLNMMSDCYRPIQEARRLARGREYILTEVKVMETDVFMHRCIAESLQARSTGDYMLEKLVKNEEDLNMDMVYSVIDWYKKAILLTREMEVEMEAIALSRLGKLYDSVLKLKSKAKDNFMRAIQLAMSLQPRTFHTELWYRTCVDTVEKYQKETVQRDEAENEKKRAKYLKELETELAALNKFEHDNNEAFLKHIYKSHPPKKSSHKLPKDLSNMGHMEMKKTLQKSIVHYHPDKQDAEKHGQKWFTLCEEITKRLTSRYECMK